MSYEPMTAVPAGYRTVDLPVSPALALSYGRALLPRRGGDPARAALPDVALRVSDVVADPDRLARYRALVGAPATGTLPLFYPSLLGFGLQMGLMTSPGFPFPVVGLVHLAHEIRQVRALSATAPLELEAHATDLRPHRLGRVFDLVTVVRQNGAPVWSQTGTFLRRERTSSAPAERDQQPVTDDDAGLAKVASWRLAAGLGRGYAAVSGDRNPIHLHPWTARPFGFSRPIAHGMWTAARLAHAVGEPFGGQVSCAVTFRRPVALPTTVDVFADPAGRHAQVRKADGTVCVDLRLH
jgi:acyl dehydratase